MCSSTFSCVGSSTWFTFHLSGRRWSSGGSSGASVGVGGGGTGSRLRDDLFLLLVIVVVVGKIQSSRRWRLDIGN